MHIKLKGSVGNTSFEIENKCNELTIELCKAQSSESARQAMLSGFEASNNSHLKTDKQKNVKMVHPTRKYIKKRKCRFTGSYTTKYFNKKNRKVEINANEMNVTEMKNEVEFEEYKSPQELAEIRRRKEVYSFKYHDKKDEKIFFEALRIQRILPVD